jgi:hypothetical protein
VAVPRGHEPRVGERPLVERAEFDIGDLDLQRPRGGGTLIYFHLAVLLGTHYRRFVGHFHQKLNGLGVGCYAQRF